MEKGLYLVSTPIGNLNDMTDRARQTLEQATVIACEDTRTTNKLLTLLGISTTAKMLAYHEYNADKMRPTLISLLEKGETVVLVSDAGTPLVSDPGYRLVRDCLDQGITVFPVPGANALLPALQLSGLPSDRFFFVGFLSSKKNARQKELQEVAAVPGTLIFYESPHRVKDTLTDMLTILGNRQASVVREITKKFEETKRGTLYDLIAEFAQEPKGEIVILVDRPQPVQEKIDLNDLLKNALSTKTVKDAASQIAKKTGLPKKQVYQKALELKYDE